jgi:hypothetical protein
MVEQAFLPVHDAGQTGMSDPPNFIIHYGRPLTRLWLRKDEKFTQYVGWAEPDTRGLLRSDKTGSAHPTTLFF